jgi:YHS domain-containing protein
MIIIIILVAAIALLGLSACKKAPETMPMEAGGMQQMHGEAAAAKEAPPLPEGIVEAGNKTCPISGEKVSGADFVVYDGKRYGLCCAGCKEMFLKDPDKYINKLRERGDIE